MYSDLKGESENTTLTSHILQLNFPENGIVQRCVTRSLFFHEFSILKKVSIAVRVLDKFMLALLQSALSSNRRRLPYYQILKISYRNAGTRRIGKANVARTNALTGGKLVVSELIRCTCGVYKIIEVCSINRVNT